MSFLLGPISGALLAGGAYFGFTTMIKTRTEQHIADLHHLSARLVDASALTTAPPPAAARIEQRPFATAIKSQWNAQVATLFRGVGDLQHRAVDWTRQTLYGGEADAAKRSS